MRTEATLPRAAAAIIDNDDLDLLIARHRRVGRLVIDRFGQVVHRDRVGARDVTGHIAVEVDDTGDVGRLGAALSVLSEAADRLLALAIEERGKGACAPEDRLAPPRGLRPPP